VFNDFISMLRSDEGQGLGDYAFIVYGIVVVFISLAAVTGLQYLGGKASNLLNSAAGQLS
jgi:Flp pilus assembly pilin Flp